MIKLKNLRCFQNVILCFFVILVLYSIIELRNKHFAWTRLKIH